MGINIDDYNIDAIREELYDYYGTAREVLPYAEADLVDLDNKSDYEILVTAINIGINLDRHYIRKRH